jgi:MFS family permease
MRVVAQPAARAAVIGTIVVGGVLALLEPLLPLDLDERLGLSATSIGLVFAAGSAAYLLSAPVMGRFSDRHGRRLPVVAGLVLTALALPFIAVGPVWVPVVAFVFVGIGMGSAIAPSGALVSEGVDDAGLEGAYGFGGALLVLVFAAGYLAGPVLGGVASLGLSFLAVTGVAAAAVLVAALGCNRLLVGR